MAAYRAERRRRASDESEAGSEIDALRAELARCATSSTSLRHYLPDAFVEGDLATERVTFMNRVACQVFRCAPEQAGDAARARHLRDGEYERAQREMREMLERGYAEGGGVYSRSGRQDLREYLMQRRDGTTFPAETQSSLILDRAGRATASAPWCATSPRARSSRRGSRRRACATRSPAASTAATSTAARAELEQTRRRTGPACSST